MSIRFDKIDRFIRIYGKSRYFTLFEYEIYDAIYERIAESGITYIFYHYFVKRKVDSYNFLPKGKISTLRNVIIHIKSVINKDKNHYYQKIFIEKCSY